MPYHWFTLRWTLALGRGAGEGGGLLVLGVVRAFELGEDQIFHQRRVRRGGRGGGAREEQDGERRGRGGAAEEPHGAGEPGEWSPLNGGWLSILVERRDALE
jgi:hypothetical protein